MTHVPRAIAMTCFIAIAFATPLGGRAVGRACAASDVHVSVVVDPGTDAAVSAVCVPAADRENGAALLAARASLLGTPQPRFGSSGLLCAIDGVPSTGCGEQHGGHYSYWSYWHGSNGKWTYASSGPASQRVDSGTVEGWRWQPDGAALPTDPPPRGPANASAVCVPQPPPTTKPPATTAAPPKKTGNTVTPTTPSTAPSSVLGAQPQPSTSPTTTTGNSTATTRTTRPRSGTTTVTRRGHASTTIDTESQSTSSIALTRGGIAAATGTNASGGSDGAPVGFIIGVLLVIGLGAGGAVAARRRRPTS